jgi:hypothetical protein
MEIRRADAVRAESEAIGYVAGGRRAQSGPSAESQMIIVTGVGRSGTSFLARLYQELGFDPGGAWTASANAGLEAPEVVRANRAIMWDLGVGLPVDGELERHAWVRLPEGLEAREVVRADESGMGIRSRLAAALPRRIREIVQGRSAGLAATARATARDPLRRRRRGPRTVDWDRFDDVVRSHRSTIHELAASRPVVKDPRFCWTLGVWAHAGAPIDHVLVCVRHLDATVRSRAAADQTPAGARHLPNTLVYGLGLCLSDIHTHRLDHAVIRFPDFLEDPEKLFELMRFPAVVERGAFLDAFGRLRDQGLVHDSR